MLKIKYFFHKLFHWEYWNQWVVYAPIIIIYLYYAAKAKTLYFINAANPKMENGGYIMESKYTIYTQLPQALQPKTIKINSTISLNEIIELMQVNDIHFPCIAKPDIGGKGVGVVVIKTTQDLTQYHEKMFVDYLIQHKVSYENEVGIFYCRLPYESHGKITGIVTKKPMLVIGNGKNTLEELVNKIPRYYFQKSFLKDTYSSIWNSVLKVDEVLVLSSIGNHARGSEFQNITHKNNALLESLIDDVSKQYNTFYFGRYDIMYNNWDDLCQGKNFSIIELNGSGSEPTHIYDPKHTLFTAWKIIISHWHYLYKIASYNHKMGSPYFSNKEGIALNKTYKSIINKM